MAEQLISDVQPLPIINDKSQILEEEKEIVEEIRRLKGQKTMIVVAHRLTTLQYCDRIYELQKGRIIRSGSPEEIINLAKI